MNVIKSIEEFSFFVGSYFGQKHKVNYKRNNVIYSSYPIIDDDNKIKKIISPDNLEIFINKLNYLKVVDWNNKYMNDVLDGEEWTLTIKYNAEKKIEIYGLMQYPGNQPGNTERSQPFNDLLSSIELLINDPGFFS